MLDINLFREDKGHNPELIRESQRRRFANVDLVDEIIRLDKEWRQREFICYYDGFSSHSLLIEKMKLENHMRKYEYQLIVLFGYSEIATFF